MRKLEQRLSDLTKQLASARRDKDNDLIEDLEDEIAEVEYELDAFYASRYSDSDDLD